MNRQPRSTGTQRRAAPGIYYHELSNAIISYRYCIDELPRRSISAKRMIQNKWTRKTKICPCPGASRMPCPELKFPFSARAWIDSEGVRSCKLGHLQTFCSCDRRNKLLQGEFSNLGCFSLVQKNNAEARDTLKIFGRTTL